jgi:copper chaperone CopZ
MQLRNAAFAAVVIALLVAAWAARGPRQRQHEQTPLSQPHLSQASASEAHVSQVSLLKVEGMFCAGCAVAVQMAAKKVAGVEDVRVSVEDSMVQVTYDPSKTNPKAIANVITTNTGFKTEALDNGRKL